MIKNLPPTSDNAARVAIYARVSSAAQRERHTIENQLRALPAFAVAQGWTIAGTYVDDGRSAAAGKLEARDGFARLVRDAEAGRFDVLLVADVDRLTRTDDMRERAAILGPFQRANIRIVTPAGGELDLRTFLGELYVTMQALVAAEENRKRAERMRAGRLRAIAEGRKPSSPTPYGLRYDRASGAWSLDPDRSAVVREIFRRVIAGESCVAIAEDLDARGAPSPRGPWKRHGVWMVVRSRHAVGEWTADRRRRLTMTIPEIVDEATWAAAQEHLKEHGRRGLIKTKHVYLLEGLAVCGACGAPMAIRSGSGRTAAAYICRARRIGRRGEPRCAAPLVRVDDCDARVWERIADVLDDSELADRVRRRSEERRADRRGWGDDVVSYERRLAQLARAEAGVLARYRRGAVSDDALDVELAAIARDRAMVGAQLETARRAAERPDDLAAAPDAWLAAVRELAATAGAEERRQIVRALVSPGAVFDGQRIRVTVRIGARDSSEGSVTGSSRTT